MDQVSGPSPGLPCHFPFQVAGRNHTACTVHVGGAGEPPYCATAPTDPGDTFGFFRMFGDPGWGFCSEGCPVETCQALSPERTIIFFFPQ